MNYNKISSCLGLKRQVCKLLLNKNSKRNFKMAENKSNDNSKKSDEKEDNESLKEASNLSKNHLRLINDCFILRFIKR